VGNSANARQKLSAALWGEDSLQMVAFAHQALQARAIENVIREFFVGEHGEGGALGAGTQLRGLFDGEVWVRLMTDITMLTMICRRRIF